MKCRKKCRNDKNGLNHLITLRNSDYVGGRGVFFNPLLYIGTREPAPALRKMAIFGATTKVTTALEHRWGNEMRLKVVLWVVAAQFQAPGGKGRRDPPTAGTRLVNRQRG
jgi:hypothetical protein